MRPDAENAAVELARRILQRPTVSVAWGGRTRVLTAADSPRHRFGGALAAPAFRWTARLGRLAIGVRLALHARRDRPVAGPVIASWLPRDLRHLEPTIAIIGTPSADQSVLVRLDDRAGRPGAVLKLAVEPITSGLEREIAALRDPTVADKTPILLHEGEFDDRRAFVASYVAGAPGSTRAAGIAQALRGLPKPAPDATRAPIVEHPWFADIDDPSLNTSHVARALPGTYPVMRLHGDFAPWNLRVQRGGHVVVIDWESSQPHGFPGIDLAHYVMVTARLMHRLPADGAATRAARVLQNECGLHAARAWATTAFAAAHTLRRDQLDDTDTAAKSYWRTAQSAALERMDSATQH